MENIITNYATKILGTKMYFVKRLLGGMSNYTCVIKDQNENYYTFRVPGKNSEKFVNRAEEEYNLGLLRNFPLTNETVHVNTENGYKISKYINGKILSEIDYISNLKLISKSLKELHSIDKKCYKDYGKLERLHQYEKICTDLKITLDKDYYLYKEKYLNLFEKFKDVKKMFSHGDFQPSNLILFENKVFMVDFEFTSNNDPYYDIACFGNLDFEYAKMLLTEYLGRKYQKDEFERLLENRLFQTLQWYLVATYKDLIGLSQELHLDFKKIAQVYLLKSKALLELV